MSRNNIQKQKGKQDNVKLTKDIDLNRYEEAKIKREQMRMNIESSMKGRTEPRLQVPQGNLCALYYRIPNIPSPKSRWLFFPQRPVRRLNQLLGSFSIDDGDGSEKLTFKMNSRLFKLCRAHSKSLKMSNVGEFPWS